jgi:hypothetical protein
MDSRNMLQYFMENDGPFNQRCLPWMVPNYRNFHETLKPKPLEPVFHPPRELRGVCKCRPKGKIHMRGCPQYIEAPLQSKGLKAANMSKTVSVREESGMNTNDNVSQNGDTANNDESIQPKRNRQRYKKDKEPEKDETEEKKKDKRKKDMRKENSLNTGTSRGEQETSIEE